MGAADSLRREAAVEVHAAAVHRLCLLELGRPDDALVAAAATLAAALDGDDEPPDEPEAVRLWVLRLSRGAVAARRRRRRFERLLGAGPGGRRRPASHLGGLRPRQRSVLALQLAAGLAPAEVAEVLDLGEAAVVAAARRGLERLVRDGAGADAGAVTFPDELGVRVRKAIAARRRRARLHPRRLLAGGSLGPLAAAVLVAAVAGGTGASIGLIGHRPAAATATRLAAGTIPAAASGPPGRAFAAAAYDPLRAETVLFGGRGAENRLLDDTWTWDGRAWHRRHPAVSPSPRKAAAMAWDPAGRRLLLFGGEGEAVLRDSWAWDGDGWTRLRSALAPPGRLGSGTAALATDTATGQLLLVGNGAPSGSPCALSTWRWSDDGWVELDPATPPRAAVSGQLAEDATAGELVLVTALPTASACGGIAATAAVWSWDGLSWTERRPGTGLAAKRIVDGRLSGAPGGIVVPGDTTWSWRAGDWHDTGPDPIGPGPRYGAAVGFDALRGRTVVFGGCCIIGGRTGGVYDDTWTWDGDSWVRRGGTRPPAAGG